jgi:putative tryptophan/tyrosine transport system substrate-binding protein
MLGFIRNSNLCAGGKAATATISIVFVADDLDPVESGLVASLNRPGGNITGITPFSFVLAGERLHLLRELVPAGAVIGLLVNPNNRASESKMRHLLAAFLKRNCSLLPVII